MLRFLLSVTFHILVRAVIHRYSVRSRRTCNSFVSLDVDLWQPFLESTYTSAGRLLLHD